jgi:conjugative transposon TraN protein
MKFLFSIIFLLVQFSLFAQNQISVSATTATHIICPEKVTYLQVGDHEKIASEVVPEHSNLVRIKAVESYEGTSSLTLVSAGKLYSFLVDFAETGPIEYRLEQFSGEETGLPAGGPVPEYILSELSRQMLFSRGRNIRNRKTKNEGIILRLEKIGQNNDLLFFQISITNKTNIGYRVEDFNWWIDDKRELKATNIQEYQVHPKYQYYDVTWIPAETTLKEVFVLPKLTIPEKRILRIEMLEKALGNTGRKLSLEIKNKDILKARKLK